jgi:CheY-like chemotaxis protein
MLDNKEYLARNKPHTILIVDNDKLMLYILKSHLTEAGFNVLEASNGKEAIAITINSLAPIDLIITDLNTPIIDGLGLANQITNFEEYKDIPILLMTSDPYINKVFYQDAVYKCFRSLLIKPVSIMKMLEEIEQILLLKIPYITYLKVISCWQETSLEDTLI